MVEPHFHKEDRILEKDLIPDDRVYSALPSTGVEGERAVVVSGSVYSFYQFFNGNWQEIGSVDLADISPLTTKGDLLTRNATIHIRLPIGTNGKVLIADSTADGGMKWDVVPSHNHPASDINSGTLDAARLGSETANSSKYLRGDQVWTDFTSSKVAIVTTDVSLTNSIIETNLVNVTIPGGVLSTNNGIRVKMLFQEFKGNDASAEVTFKFKYGGTTLITRALKCQTVTHQGRIEFLLLGSGATNIQEGHSDCFFCTLEATTDSAVSIMHAVNNGTSAINSTTDQTLTITAQWDATDVNRSLIMQAATIEKLI